jgi:plastocyanin
MRKVLSAAAAVAIAAGITALPATGATTKTVSVKDDFFGPKKLSIKKGVKVKWVWRGQESHNVATANGPSKFRFNKRRKGSKTYTFKKRGTYNIVCTIHAPDMHMKIVVK